MTAYLFPQTLDEAVGMLVAHAGQARIISGGTDIMPDIRKARIVSTCFIDITRIPELTSITVEGGWATIGAATPFVALREHPYFAGHVHALVDAAASVGATAIQSAATWAGNLVQAMPAADGAIIAVALDAQVEVMDAAGAHWALVGSLYEGPGHSRIDPTHQLIARIRFPIPSGVWGTAWRRAGRRPSLVLPTLNCAVTITLTGGVVDTARIAMGPVGPRPVRAMAAEAFLTGRAPDASTLARAAEIALCDADPRSNALRGSREYRLAVLPVLVEAALTDAVGRATAGLA